MLHDSAGPLDTVALLDALNQGGRALAEASRFTDGVKRLLAHIGQATGGSRVWIFQLIDFQEEAIIQDYVFEWAAAARYRQLTQRRFRFFSTLFDDPEFMRLVNQRRLGQRQSTITHRLAPGSLRANLESQSILSMATVPILVNGRWWGTLGIDDCERAIDWEGPGLDTLAIAAELIAAGLSRQQLSSRSSQVELFHKVTDCGVWEVDLTSGDFWCSQGLRRLLGYPDSYPHVPLRRVLVRLVGEDRERLFASLRQALHDGIAYWRQDARVRIADGRTRWSEVVADITYDTCGRPLGIAGLLIDISRHKLREQQALIASHHDALTDLLNRRGLEQHFAALPRPVPGSGDGPAEAHLLLLDLDYFKRVNDRHGHPVGDALLCLVARRIQGTLRHEDAFARIGGEEFAILTTAMAPNQALELAERIRRAVADEPFSVAPGENSDRVTLSVSLSIGLTRVPPLDDVHERQAVALARADRALYIAKHRGRNQVEVDDEAPVTVNEARSAGT
ncbi:MULTISPECIES: sensor domain-containing diguanylate cyclase [unclassified Modicisalibacter]|uniref:GGDEF domain-containing protein n=1 Tax=unclassified Modicisalibacter TaxID=2679913 RepID=UPI001CCF1428|nr:MULTISPECIES: sensor domain-containing diguanylate cyclase [unclassified Modicisalibacter]MBZ9559611.1 diguanylate cyclase [Modicisalibacter sp. R2A 31.J]MBZ9577063.1 diguanylate cyclase [Modicisalibacter sp. MOD 31.J]